MKIQVPIHINNRYAVLNLTAQKKLVKMLSPNATIELQDRPHDHQNIVISDGSWSTDLLTVDIDDVYLNQLDKKLGEAIHDYIYGADPIQAVITSAKRWKGRYADVRAVVIDGILYVTDGSAAVRYPCSQTAKLPNGVNIATEQLAGAIEQILAARRRPVDGLIEFLEVEKPKKGTHVVKLCSDAMYSTDETQSRASCDLPIQNTYDAGRLWALIKSVAPKKTQRAELAIYEVGDDESVKAAMVIEYGDVCALILALEER